MLLDLLPLNLPVCFQIFDYYHQCYYYYYYCYYSYYYKL